MTSVVALATRVVEVANRSARDGSPWNSPRPGTILSNREYPRDAQISVLVRPANQAISRAAYQEIVDRREMVGPYALADANVRHAHRARDDALIYAYAQRRG